MSFMFPRTISVLRAPRAPFAVGASLYSQARPADAIPVKTGISCSIQEKSQGMRPMENLPGDAEKTPDWVIFVPKRLATLGDILIRDYILDDQGNCYHVVNPYWHSLGFRLFCQLLASAPGAASPFGLLTDTGQILLTDTGSTILPE